MRKLGDLERAAQGTPGSLESSPEAAPQLSSGVILDAAGVAKLANAGDLKTPGANRYPPDSRHFMVGPPSRGDRLGTAPCAISANLEQT
jgi:hypothetical protein